MMSKLIKKPTSEAQKRATIKWQKANKEKVAGYNKNFYENNKESCLERMRVYDETIRNPKFAIEPALKYLGYKDACFKEFRIFRNMQLF
jgi:hypothetical protein